MPVNTRRLKALPKAHSISLGRTIQQLLQFFFDNLSGYGFKKRCQRWKGKSGILLFMFAFLDLVLLPITVYQRSHSSIGTGAISALTLFFFLIGVFNVENAIGVPFALFYCLIWILMAPWYLNSNLNLGLPQVAIFLFILVATILRLLLFLWRTPFGQR